MAPTDLVIVHFAHRRAKSLKWGLEQSFCILPQLGVDVVGVIVHDRPTPEVKEVLEVWRRHPRVKVVHAAPRPVRSPSDKFPDEGFTRTRNFALELVDRADLRPAWICFRDDDHIWLDPWQAKIAGCLADEGTDSWQAVSLFAWNENRDINVNQHHCSPHFSRYKPGWRIRQDMCLHITEPARLAVLERPEREKVLPWFILDVGTLTEAERVRLYKETARCGKMDAYTEKYVALPKLVPLPKLLHQFDSPATFWQYSWE